MSTFQIKGQAKANSQLRETVVALQQSIDGIELKGPMELTIPHGGAYTSVPLNFSSTITEAVVLLLQCSKKLKLAITTSDGVAPGPARLGFKGMWVIILYPGEGVTVLSAANPDTTDDALLEYVVGTMPADGSTPDFYA